MATDPKSDGIGIVNIKMDGESIMHAINSPMYNMGGVPFNSRSVADGNDVIAVHTQNGEDALSKLTFDVPTTVYGVELINTIRNNRVQYMCI